MQSTVLVSLPYDLQSSEIQHDEIKPENCSLETGANIYAANRAGILASFNRNGELIYHVQTIEPVQFPKIFRQKREGSVGYRIDPQAEWSAISLSATAKEIYIFTESKISHEVISLIDAYDSRNGKYLYSIKLPEQADWAYATSTHIYSIKDTSLTKWARLAP